MKISAIVTFITAAVIAANEIPQANRNCLKTAGYWVVTFYIINNYFRDKTLYQLNLYFNKAEGR